MNKNNNIFLHSSSASGRFSSPKAPFKRIEHNLSGGGCFPMTDNCTTATISPTSPLTRAATQKFSSMVSVDFTKAELRLYAFRACYSGLEFAQIQMYLMNMSKSKLNPTPYIRRPKLGDMTKKEIEIQMALGTLSFREYMKRQGILFENTWWYFPISKTMKCKSPRTVTIDNQEHYPVADGYITDLHHSMNHRKWTEEEFAKEIIIQCYQCMGMETIDH